MYVWDKVFNNGPSKICGRKPLKHLKRYGLLILSNFLQAVFHKLYLVHSWILCPIYVHNPFNPFHLSVAFHIETSHLICSANQMIGFYMKCNTRLKSFIRYEILGKEKYISPTIAQLSVFMRAFCHMRVENLLKGSAPPYARAHPHMMNKNLFLPMIWAFQN